MSACVNVRENDSRANTNRRNGELESFKGTGSVKKGQEAIMDGCSKKDRQNSKNIQGHYDQFLESFLLFFPEYKPSSRKRLGQTVVDRQTRELNTKYLRRGMLLLLLRRADGPVSV